VTSASAAKKKIRVKMLADKRGHRWSGVQRNQIFIGAAFNRSYGRSWKRGKKLMAPGTKRTRQKFKRHGLLTRG